MQYDTGKRNNVIIITRIVAMISIILCHIIGYYTFIPGSQFLNVVFNVGVFIFLIISGYLYGKKNISFFRKWITKRIQRVYVPVIITVIPFAVICTIKNINFSTTTIIAYLLNLQGLIFLDSTFFSNFITEIDGIGHLWFTTVIMMCYFLVPLLQKIKNSKISFSYGYIVVLIVLSYFSSTFFSISLIYFCAFILGYFIGSFENFEKLTKIQYTLLTIIMIIMQGFRLLLMYLIDGTAYYSSFTGLSHLCLGMWVVATFFVLNNRFSNCFNKLSNTKIVGHIDKMSFYIYISHGIFTTGIFNVYDFSDNLIISTLMFFTFTYVLAVLIYLLSKIININLDKLVDKKVER